jgi:uncharacterized membrane protein
VQVSVRVHGWWDALRDSLWVIPGASVLAAVVLAGVLTRFEPLPAWFPTTLIFTGTPDGARAILAQLAGATITVTGLVFSMTVIALQMAATQFSPRLLRTFLRDRRVQIVLSAMVGSAVYAVGVLRTVRSAGESVVPFVPRLAVTIALLASFAAVGLLIYFIHYVAQHLRVDVVMREIVAGALTQLERIPAERDDLPDREAPDPPAGAVPIWARRGGYLQLVDGSGLAHEARSRGAVVRLRPTLGEWVTQGTTVAWVWGDTDDGFGDRDELTSMVHRFLHLGVDRTESTDLAFGLRQLQDIATRALSPGVNDPTTAVLAIEQMSAVLCRYAGHPLGDDLVEDADGDRRTRVAVPRPGFAALVELAVGPSRRYAPAEPDVLAALLTLLIDVAEHVADSADRSAVVRDQVERIRRTADLDDAADRARIERVAGLAIEALDRGMRAATVTEAN